jgi:hypothetical protein
LAAPKKSLKTLASASTEGVAAKGIKPCGAIDPIGIRPPPGHIASGATI